jgi:hypothetical protein
MRKLALFALAAFFAISAHAAQTITICKNTVPPGGAGFPFTWQNGSSGPVTPFVLNDGGCMTFDVTALDKFNIFKENVPAGWTLTNISCAYTTSAVSITGADPNPGFQPGDNTVNIDLNEANVTCKFTDEQKAVTYTDVYAVKFVCGDFRPTPPTVPPDGVEYPVKPGNYYTAINLHNPNSSPIGFRKKAVLLYRADKPPAAEIPQPPGKLYDAKLEPDWGFEIDCPDIRNVLLNGLVPAHTFIKGWVILEVKGADPLPLDVTTVYTSHGWERKGNTWLFQGWAEDVEPTLPKRVK